MKKRRLYDLEVEMTDGSVRRLLSTVELGRVKLDIDHLNHPAWNKGRKDFSVFDNISRFQEKFGVEEL